MHRIRVLRKEKDEDQKELAAILGVTSSAVSQWETGRKLPPVDKLLTIAERYGVSIDYIVENSESRNAGNLRPILLLKEYIYEVHGQDLGDEALDTVNDLIMNALKLRGQD